MKKSTRSFVFGKRICIKDNILSINRDELFEHVHVMKSELFNSEIPIVKNRPFRKYTNRERSDIYANLNSVSHDRMQNFSDFLQKREFLRDPFDDGAPSRINFGNPYAPKRKKRSIGNLRKSSLDKGGRKGFLGSDVFDKDDEDILEDDDDQVNSENDDFLFSETVEEEDDSFEDIFGDKDKIEFVDIEEFKDFAEPIENEGNNEDSSITGKKRKREYVEKENILKTMSSILGNEKFLTFVKDDQFETKMNEFECFTYHDIAYDRFKNRNKEEISRISGKIKSFDKIDGDQVVKTIDELEENLLVKDRYLEELADLSFRFVRPRFGEKISEFRNQMWE